MEMLITPISQAYHAKIMIQFSELFLKKNLNTENMLIVSCLSLLLKDKNSMKKPITLIKRVEWIMYYNYIALLVALNI